MELKGKKNMNSTYNIVHETEKSTVVTEYKKAKKQKRTETSYQSEETLKKYWMV